MEEENLPSYQEISEDYKERYLTLLANLKTIRDAHKQREQELRDPRSEVNLKILAELARTEFEEMKMYSDIFHENFKYTANEQDVIQKEDILGVFKKNIKGRPKMKVIRLFCKTTKDSRRIKRKMVS